MKSWLLRGLVFAFGMIVVRLVQGALINMWETRATLISITLVAILFVVALLWGFVDGRADAKAQPDPERRSDLAMTWLLAGLLAGVLSGAVCWFIKLFYDDIYVAQLMNEVTTFAAFTALLVFLGAIIGVSVGRFLVDRGADNQPRRRGTGDEESADTDVFAAVSAGPTRPVQTQAAPTQPVPMRSAPSAPTEPVKTQQDEGRTEAIPTQPVRKRRGKDQPGDESAT